MMSLPGSSTFTLNRLLPLDVFFFFFCRMPGVCTPQYIWHTAMGPDYVKTAGPGGHFCHAVLDDIRRDQHG